MADRRLVADFCGAARRSAAWGKGLLNPIVNRRSGGSVWTRPWNNLTDVALGGAFNPSIHAEKTSSEIRRNRLGFRPDFCCGDVAKLEFCVEGIANRR